MAQDLGHRQEHDTVPPMEILNQLIQTVHQLRAPGGCPWDRAQTHQSLRPYLIEEAYEVLDVLDQIQKPEDLQSPRLVQNFQEELGDLLMQVLLHAEIASESGTFHIQDVARTLNDKLIRRHPHVFGDQKVSSADQALQNWEKQKAKEKSTDLQASILDGLPKGLPALQRAGRVLEKVTQVGFQWKDLQGPLQKVDEELLELKQEIEALETKAKSSESTEDLRKKVESELGDLFLSLCNLAFLLKVNPEGALRQTLTRFEKRFRHVEKRLKQSGRSPESSTLEEMDLYWDEAKKREKTEVWGLTGGVASGKSTAAALFKEYEIPVINADQIARELSQEGKPAFEAIFNRFQTTDRKKLRELIFSDPAAKQDLEAILHPLIQAEAERQIRELAPQHPIIVYEAPLLVETGGFRHLTGLLVVEAPETVRIQRLVHRDSISPDLAHKMVQSQASDEQRRKQATLVLENDGTLEQLRTAVESFIQKRKSKVV